ncbi:MAG: hypothetical protein WC791_02455 [Candidatus Paceibacterota bacterium]|jgi:hypothetical protein
MIGTNQNILSAAEAVERFLEPQEHFFRKVTTWLQLRKGKRMLFSLLNVCSHCDDPKVFLKTGEILQRAKEFEHAKFCYGRVIELLDDCNKQDMRLLALTGKLECKVALTWELLNSGNEDTEISNGLEELLNIILTDLHAASPEVQQNIKTRLTGRFKLDCAVLTLKMSVRTQKQLLQKFPKFLES